MPKAISAEELREHGNKYRNQFNKDKYKKYTLMLNKEKEPKMIEYLNNKKQLTVYLKGLIQQDMDKQGI